MYIRVSYADKAELQKAEAIISKFALGSCNVIGNRNGQCLVAEIKDADYDALVAKIEAANDQMKLEF